MKDLSRYINKVPVKVELDTSMEKILAIQLLYKQVIDVMDTIEGGSVINVKSDWNAEAGSESEILNKPNLKTVATSGSYNDLSDKPHIPNDQVQADWNQTNSSAVDFIKNKPTTLKTFKDSWTTDDTLLALCQEIVADTDVRVGDIYTGQVTCSGLPTGMNNGEIEVQVKEGLNDDKLLFITITSTNLSPYHWERSFYNDEFNDWVSFDLIGAAAAVLGTDQDTKDDNTVFGAKAFSNYNKSLVIGTNQDQKTDDTIFGAKAFATDAVASEALRTNNYAAIVALASDSNAATTTTTTNPEWKLVYTDADDRILIGKRQDNTWYFAADLDDILDAIIDGYGT